MEFIGWASQTPRPIAKEKVFELKAEKSNQSVELYKVKYARLLDKKENLSFLDHKDGLYVTGKESYLWRNNIVRFQQRFLREVYQ